jgi:uncharacterized coiled-coil protein SlyX
MGSSKAELRANCPRNARGDPVEERLTEMEVLYAFQEKRIGELDEVIRQLRAEVDQLRADLVQVQRHLSSAPTEDAPPPHW